MTPTNLLEVFSAGYYITTEQIQVLEYNGDRAVMPRDLYEELQVDGGPVVVKTGQAHYCVEPESAIPSGVLALPSVKGDNEWRDLLVARPGHAEYLLGG